MDMTTSWAARDFLAALIMWAVMMVAMMTPAAAPVLVLFARTRASKGSSGTIPVALFTGGYIAVWVGFSLAAASLQFLLHEAALLSPRMSVSNRYLAGAILVGAGLFQFTPLKYACLSQCRSPLGSLMSYWRDGGTGAFLMGLRQGLFCLGCCWAEMLVLFVVGIMNLTWIVLLAAFVMLEKLSALGRVISRAGGAVMIGAGFYLILGQWGR